MALPKFPGQVYMEVPGTFHPLRYSPDQSFHYQHQQYWWKPKKNTMTISAGFRIKNGVIKYDKQLGPQPTKSMPNKYQAPHKVNPVVFAAENIPRGVLVSGDFCLSWIPLLDGTTSVWNQVCWYQWTGWRGKSKPETIDCSPKKWGSPVTFPLNQSSGWSR